MRRAAIVALASLLSVSCSDLAVIPPVQVRPAERSSSELFDRLLGATTARGYTTPLVQANRGRFAARARYTDQFGWYVLAVELMDDGRIVITPIGPRVERETRQWIMPAGLRDELVELAAALYRVER